MAATPYTHAIIAPSNYRPLPTVSTNYYTSYTETPFSDSVYGSLPLTILSNLFEPISLMSQSEVLNISSGSERPTSGMVYPRLLK